ncbi:F0F1 ATP synthase subunit delta [Candidatus Kaiserbacteria bacterium]|nr:F0F1 ATP synthase subunit delta [Candidatus Kaiserbacteria bacterium]
MSLASHYAAVLSQGTDVKKTLAYMKARGHTSLLSQIVRIVERKPADKDIPVVVLAKDFDSRKYSKDIHEALAMLGAGKEHRTKVDARAVGGYAVRAGGTLIDKTFRSALVDIYKDTFRSPDASVGTPTNRRG